MRAPSKNDDPECPSNWAMISLVAGSLPAPVYSATSAALMGTSRTKASCAALGASTPGQAMISPSSAKSPAFQNTSSIEPPEPGIDAFMRAPSTTLGRTSSARGSLASRTSSPNGSLNGWPGSMPPRYRPR